MLYDGTPIGDATIAPKPEFAEDSWVSVYNFPDPDVQADTHISGITGLIQLGAAWRSLDAFHSLSAVLEAGRHASLAELSYLRELELVEQGAGSLHPVSSVRAQIIPKHSSTLEERDSVFLYYPVARQAAVNRNRAWFTYQTERFAKGMHPDTHQDFWDAWIEPTFPKLPGPTLRDRYENLFGLLVLVGIVVIVVLFVSIFFKFLRILNRSPNFVSQP